MVKNSSVGNSRTMSHDSQTSIAWIVGFASGLACSLFAFLVHQRRCRSRCQQKDEDLQDLEANAAGADVKVSQTVADAQVPKSKVRVDCITEDTSSTRSSEFGIGEDSGGSLESASPTWRCMDEEAKGLTLHFAQTRSPEDTWQLGQDSLTPKTPATVRAKLESARIEMGFCGDIEAMADMHCPSDPVCCEGDIDELAQEGTEGDLDELLRKLPSNSAGNMKSSATSCEGDIDEVASQGSYCSPAQIDVSASMWQSEQLHVDSQQSKKINICEFIL